MKKASKKKSKKSSNSKKVEHNKEAEENVKEDSEKKEESETLEEKISSNEENKETKIIEKPVRKIEVIEELDLSDKSPLRSQQNPNSNNTESRSLPEENKNKINRYEIIKGYTPGTRFTNKEYTLADFYTGQTKDPMVLSPVRFDVHNEQSNFAFARSRQNELIEARRTFDSQMEEQDQLRNYKYKENTIVDRKKLRREFF